MSEIKKLEPVDLRLEWEYFNLTKVMDLLSTQHPLLPGQGAEVVVIPANAKRSEVVTRVLLKLKEGAAQLSCDLTRFDCDVLDAVYSIAKQAREVAPTKYILFTLEQVVHALYGKPESDVTPQQLADVEASLDKLAVIRIRIDCTDELIARRKAIKGHATIFEDYLLPVKKYKESDMVAARNGRPARVAYQLMSTPITYMYAEIIGQIACVPTRQFQAGEGMSDTKEMLAIKRYLIRRVAIMSNAHNRAVSRRIAYEWWDGDRRKGMYEALGYAEGVYSDSQWRKKRVSIHKAVCTVLNWMIKDGTIAGYEVVHAGRKITGVDIILKDDLKTGNKKNKKEAHT